MNDRGNLVVARRHHYVPKCYLKLFSAEVTGKQNRELFVFDGTSRKSFKTAPENVALERDFNTIDLDGHEPDAFEKSLASVESEIGPALLRISEAGSLENADDKNLLLNLIGLLHVRNPRFREIKRDFHERVQKVVLDLVLSSKEMWESQFKRAQAAGYMPADAVPGYEGVKKAYNENSIKAVVPVIEHIQSEMDTFDHVLPLLAERRWVLVKAPDSASFVTGDHPVSLSWSEPKRGPIGLKHRGTEIFFPISPKLAVVGAYELEDGVADVTETQVASANGTTILNAQRQVYSLGDDFAYQIDQSKNPRKAAELIGDEQFKPGDAA